MATSRSALVAGGVFAAGLTLSVYKLWRLGAVRAEHEHLTGKRPRVGLSELLAILGETEAAARAAVRDVKGALELAKAQRGEGSEGEAEAAAELEAAARPLVQAELAAAQARIFSEHGVREADVAHALAYFGPHGAGASASVAAAVAGVRGAAGLYFVTKSAVLAAMQTTFGVQAQVLAEAAEGAIGAGALRSPAQLQGFFMSRALQARIAEAVEGATREATGLTVEQMDAVTKRPEYTQDAAFQAALGRVVAEGSAALQEVQQRIAQQAQQAMMGGGRGGMGGMMGMMGM